jgi:hypothetical protein
MLALGDDCSSWLANHPGYDTAAAAHVSCSICFACDLISSAFSWQCSVPTCTLMLCAASNVIGVLLLLLLLLLSVGTLQARS